MKIAVKKRRVPVLSGGQDQANAESVLPLPAELGFTRVRQMRWVEVGYIRLRLGERVGVRGQGPIEGTITPHPPAAADASAGDLSPRER
jgi:hypothetical protein